MEGTGLVVPVLRDAPGARPAADRARPATNWWSRARGGKLTPADVRGGTFTISNHGVSGSLLADADHHQPAAGGDPRHRQAGAAARWSWKRQRRESIAVQPRCYVTLTLDHRVMDGHQANRFLQTFVRQLTDWSAQ